jgi:hypothetical protein
LEDSLQLLLSKIKTLHNDLNYEVKEVIAVVIYLLLSLSKFQMLDPRFNLTRLVLAVCFKWNLPQTTLAALSLVRKFC